MLNGNMLIAHGGGPTPVINSSLLGAVREAKRHPEIETIYGARFGAEGILAGDLMDLGRFSDEELGLLSRTPASALGSCRRKLTDADYPAVLECFKKFNIRYFFYNGGNDSMDTCHKVYQLACQSGYELRVIGIPKTIDNDLAVTDHCPGFGSAAKYAAVSALELAFDASALPIHVVVMELMGRNAGWITAASALFADRMPCEHLVYLPETDFDKEQFLAAVQGEVGQGPGPAGHRVRGHPLRRRFARGRLGHCGRLRPQDPRRRRPDPQRHDHAGDGAQVPLGEARPAGPGERGSHVRGGPAGGPGGRRCGGARRHGG